jgi:hypothetical protein
VIGIIGRGLINLQISLSVLIVPEEGLSRWLEVVGPFDRSWLVIGIELSSFIIGVIL